MSWTSTVLQLSLKQLLGEPNIPDPGKMSSTTHFCAFEEYLKIGCIDSLENNGVWCYRMDPRFSRQKL